MTPAARPTLFGPVMQLGFVVPDLEAAALHWAGLGVGPFFLMEHIQYAECRYRGQPVSFDMSVAVGQWGEVQVELIRRYREGKSDERVRLGIHLSINGISAGLRNTG